MHLIIKQQNFLNNILILNLFIYSCLKVSCQNLNSWDGNSLDQNNREEFENKYTNKFPKLIEWPKEGQIGSHCNPDLHGACNVQNSHCFNGICECLPMWVFKWN
uniref:EB domain-containing protein n=1 Tax=Meloidogyne hapla TaxID=6305 RepID=A0A1I8C0B8_MELHA